MKKTILSILTLSALVIFMIINPVIADTDEEIAAKNKYLEEVFYKAWELMENGDDLPAKTLLIEVFNSKYRELYTDADVVKLYYAVGWAFLLQPNGADEEKAILYFDEALELDPKHEKSLIMKNLIYVNAAENEKALEAAKKAKLYLIDEKAVNFNNKLLDELPAVINNAATQADLYTSLNSGYKPLISWLRSK